MNQKNVDVNIFAKQLEIFDVIVFNSEKHTYAINGQPSNPYSVTRLINSVKPRFDTDKWANIKAKKEGITPEELKFIWKEKALFSTTLGTCVHEIIESVYTGDNILQYTRSKLTSTLGEESYLKLKEKITKCVNLFKKFYTDTRDNLIPIKNELIIGDINDTRICGTLDFLAYNNKTGNVEIYDFKTNNSITTSNPYGETFYYPLKDLDICEYNTYTLQLSLYQFIIEKYTNIKIDKKYILWLNDNNTNYQLIEVPYLKNAVQHLLNEKSRSINLSQLTHSNIR